MQYLREGRKHWNIGRRSKYLNELNRNQASTIINARLRMLKVRCNYWARVKVIPRYFRPPILYDDNTDSTMAQIKAVLLMLLLE